MKKILLLAFLSLIINFNAEAAGYIFPKNLYTDCDILTKKDPTSFKKYLL